MWLAQDFDDLPRPLDGNGDATGGIDLGAHEVITENADSSGDGIPDGWSFRHGLNPLDPGLASGNPDQDPFTSYLNQGDIDSYLQAIGRA